MDLYGQLLHNVKQFIPQVNMAPGLARNARGPRLLTMLYSESMKTQHLYFRYLSNIHLSIKILFSSYNCTLHILSNDYSLHWFVVNMHCLKVLVQKQVIWLPAMFRMSDLYFCILLSKLTESITFSQHQHVDMCSPYQNIRRENLLKIVQFQSWWQR